MFTDASMEGWGAHWDDNEISGQWSDTMKNQHINVLEMEAVFRALKHWEMQFHQ